MWETDLRPADKLKRVVILFYGLFYLVIYWVTKESLVLDYLAVLYLLNTTQLLLILHRIRNTVGNFALFLENRTFYWRHQRWHLVREPLYFRGLVVLPLQSKQMNHCRTLFLIRSQFSAKEWHHFNFYLRKSSDFIKMNRKRK